ncbi:MAG: hypothetical protein U0Z44_08200 [Kouleothrix sp.]
MAETVSSPLTRPLRTQIFQPAQAPAAQARTRLLLGIARRPAYVIRSKAPS